MARRVKDDDLENRTARSKLRARGKPYYRRIDEGLHLGYRRLSGQRSGKWTVRSYLGAQTYCTETIATADDLSDPNSADVLTYDQATAKARKLRDQRSRAGKGDLLTVRGAIEAYLGYLETHKKTGRDARYRAEALILPKLGNIEVEALTTAMIRKWLADIAKAPARRRTGAGQPQRYREVGDDDEAIRRRRSTANRILSTLRSALNQAWHDGLVRSDTEWRRVKPFERVDAARTRHLSVAEAKRLINAAAADGFRDLVTAALQTGARYSELSRLVVADFDPDTGTLHIRKSKVGKGRHIVLTDEGIAYFSGLCAGRPGSKIMLPKPNGAAWGKSDQARFMADACTRAQIEPITFHGMRHSYASLSIMAGMPLMVCAENLGHANTRMLEKNYGHLSREYMTAQVRRTAPKFGVSTTNVVPLK